VSRNFHRYCTLALSGKSGRTITGGGFTDLRITFAIKQWDLQSPNVAKLKIWNPGKSTIAQFQNKEFTKVDFSAGYEDNVGLIFSGEIKQAIVGHETATDTYIEIFAASGDTGYNQGRISTTLAKGHTPQDRVDAAIKAMAPFGVSLGLVNVDLSQPRYPRGIPLVGMARDVLRSVALSAGATWSIQNGEKVHIVDQRKPVTGNAIKLTASTGLIGWPRQTQDGIEVTSLLNPALQPHANIELDPSQIIAAQQAIVVNSPATARQNIFLDAQGLGDGTYNIFHIDRQGDTRGPDWYDTSLCIGRGRQVGPSQAQLGYYTLGQS
jgi:hypothetical protein